MKASAHRVDHGLEIRVHPQGDYGTTYTWCALAVPLDSETVEIRLVQTAPRQSERRAAEQALLEIGYNTVVWHRPSGHVAGPYRMRG